MRSPPPANVIAAVGRIRAVLGPAGCLEAAADIAPYLVDLRGLYHGATPLRDSTAFTNDVAAVLAICHELGVGVVPTAATPATAVGRPRTRVAMRSCCRCAA